MTTDPSGRFRSQAKVMDLSPFFPKYSYILTMYIIYRTMLTQSIPQSSILVFVLHSLIKQSDDRKTLRRHHVIQAENESILQILQEQETAGERSGELEGVP